MQMSSFHHSTRPGPLVVKIQPAKNVKGIVETDYHQPRIKFKKKTKRRRKRNKVKERRGVERREEGKRRLCDFIRSDELSEFFGGSSKVIGGFALGMVQGQDD